ncbi:MAG: hypothetical protein GXO74_07285 [Calditrichaeota bacterium]|nr:hypothetical protein [Calditrichota bacterium]
MQTAFNIMISIVIFSLLMMIVVGVDGNVKSVSRQLSGDKIAQEMVVGIAELIDHDFAKIGYMKTAPKFKLGALDSNKITFYCDYDNNGLMDSVSFYFDRKVSAVKSNPHIRHLYRKMNNQNPEKVALGIVYFNLAYFDENMNPISYGKLADVNYVNQIKAIRVRLRAETQFQIENHFGSAYWGKVYFPKNLNL